jgi:hypothetical protein
MCGAFPARPGCPNVGFAYQLDTSGLGPGQHNVTVSATNTDNSPETGSVTLTLTVTAIPPTVHIDAPLAASVLSGTTTVSGWALDNASAVGTAISSLQVKVDGVLVGTAT